MRQFACPRCGAEDLVVGALQSTGMIHFRPNDIRFLTFLTADISVQAHMCASCGAVTLLGDVEKLKRVKCTQKGRTGADEVLSST